MEEGEKVLRGILRAPLKRLAWWALRIHGDKEFMMRILISRMRGFDWTKGKAALVILILSV